MTTAAETVETRQGPAHAWVRDAALVAALASFAVAVAAVPDLNERLGWPPFLLWTVPLMLLIAYGGERAEHTPDAARVVARKFGPAIVAVLVVVAAGMALHPLVTTNNYLATVALGVLGVAFLVAREAMTENGAKARARTAVALVISVGLMFAAWLAANVLMAAGFAQPVIFVVLAIAIAASLVIGARRRQAR
jgi:hypothetical protein